MLRPRWGSEPLGYRIDMTTYQTLLTFHKCSATHTYLRAENENPWSPSLQLKKNIKKITIILMLKYDDKTDQNSNNATSKLLILFLCTFSGIFLVYSILLFMRLFYKSSTCKSVPDLPPKNIHTQLYNYTIRRYCSELNKMAHGLASAGCTL